MILCFIQWYTLVLSSCSSLLYNLPIYGNITWQPEIMNYISVSSQIFLNHICQMILRWSCHDVIFSVCVILIIDKRGQDGYFGRTAVLHPDQHPLWRRTSHRTPAPTGSRSVFGSYFICIWQWFLSWGFSHFMLGLTSRPHFL